MNLALVILIEQEPFLPLTKIEDQVSEPLCLKRGKAMDNIHQTVAVMFMFMEVEVNRDHAYCCSSGQTFLHRIDLLHNNISFKMVGFKVLTAVTDKRTIFLMYHHVVW
jgi:hypothetical protein